MAGCTMDGSDVDSVLKEPTGQGFVAENGAMMVTLLLVTCDSVK